MPGWAGAAAGALVSVSPASRARQTLAGGGRHRELLLRAGVVLDGFQAALGLLCPSLGLLARPSNRSLHWDEDRVLGPIVDLTEVGRSRAAGEDLHFE